MSYHVVDRETCRDFSRSSKLEWLETNGTGAFAMGTVAGVNTRRYHGLLVASLKPPVERFLALARVEEEAGLQLGACQYPGTVTPRGFENLEQFTNEPCATWRYSALGLVIEKQVYLEEGRQAVTIRYRSSQPTSIRVRPFLAYRDYHSLTHSNASVNLGVERTVSGLRMQPYSGMPPMEFQFAGSFTEDPRWYFNNEYLEELERGLDFREDLFTPGVIELALEADTWTWICCSIDGTSASQPPAEKREPFVVTRSGGGPTIIAGYPWFTDWGRDTMISLPGLLIHKGWLREARQILEGFLGYLDQGLIPNRFPDAGQLPEYNNVDGTLWMFQAVREYLAAGGDRSFLRDVFYGPATEIIDWHRRGTYFDIRVDPTDGLLSTGNPQLTWMDANVGDQAATPRNGKPVEINALWHSALRLMADWGAELGDPAAAFYRKEAAQVRQSFQKFWNADRECLYDVLRDDGAVAKLRPNQIFAVSLPHPLLEPAQQQAVVRIVQAELLTPVGLRTLERGDPDYHPRCHGSAPERDAAYHQGTVWPWLLGPFVDAYLNAFGVNEANVDYCQSLVDALRTEAAYGSCLGSIGEIYDGDEPRRPRGCPAQAWSVAEMDRADRKLRALIHYLENLAIPGDPKIGVAGHFLA